MKKLLMLFAFIIGFSGCKIEKINRSINGTLVEWKVVRKKKTAILKVEKTTGNDSIVTYGVGRKSERLFDLRPLLNEIMELCSESIIDHYYYYYKCRKTQYTHAYYPNVRLPDHYLYKMKFRIRGLDPKKDYYYVDRYFSLRSFDKFLILKNEQPENAIQYLEELSDSIMIPLSRKGK